MPWPLDAVPAPWPPAGDRVPPPENQALRAELEKRKIWFHECHLRGWNLACFRRFTQEDTIEQKGEAIFEGLDGLRKWPLAELLQRNELEKGAIGEQPDWLGYRRPVELIKKLQDLEAEFFASIDSIEPPPYEGVHPYRPREAPGVYEDALFHGVSRLELTEHKPWLIESLFGWSPDAFVRFTEDELLGLYGLNRAQWLGDLSAIIEPLPRMARVAFLDAKMNWLVQCGTRGNEPRPLTADPNDRNRTYAPKAVYWLRLVDNPMKEAFFLKANSDMGLTHLVRVLYLYGSLPSAFDRKQIRWRRRRFDDKQFANLMALAAKSQVGLTALDRRRIADQYEALGHLLTANAADVRACDVRFSLVAEEVLKQALLRYKFWLDEPFHLLDPRADDSNEKDPVVAAFNDARKKNRPPQDQNSAYEADEMEFWSENHYLMFASAEYLLGQLWPGETFQPAKDFLADTRPDFGTVRGEQRRQRGKARVLRYLNNRLAFGWTEWNSAGYYREHFEALSNLVDFALDGEVLQKARMVMDLLWFDIARFTHKGALGAAAGRAQFKTKRSGRDQAIGDAIELAFGTRELFKDEESAVGAIFATSCFDIPDVLLEIGTHPPDDAFVDRSRVSITFDEAARFGIGHSMDSREKRSRELGYAEKLAMYSPDQAPLLAALSAQHFDYGKREDDAVFWWTTSAYFTKYTIDDTIELATRWGLTKTKAFKALETMFGDAFAPVDNVALAAAGGHVGSTLGANAAGALGATALGAAGAATGFLLGGSFINAKAVSAWGKVALYGLAGGVLGPLGFALAAFELGNPFSDEQHADDLSVMVEGSVRTRANLYTYRCPEAMLSSAQNFRAGQLNFQSNHNEVTLSGEVSAFTSSPYTGATVPKLLAGIGGWLAFTPGPLAPLGAAGGVLGAVSAGDDIAQIRDHDDGPGWWTGYWAAPKIVQYENAAILLYDFHWTERLLCDPATHLWLPLAGLTELEWTTPNWDSFDDTDNPIEDVEEFFSDAIGGKNGHWAFARLVHRVNPDGSPAEEAYLGVFSNQRLKTLAKNSDFYQTFVDQRFKDQRDHIKDLQKQIDDRNDKIDDKLDALEDDEHVGYVGRQAIEVVVDRYLTGPRDQTETELRESKAKMVRDHADSILELIDLTNERNRIQADHDAQQAIWGRLLDDYFARQDHHADGKNIMIVQVGGATEYGSFDAFKTRLRNTRIKIDTGDLECRYDIPSADGATTLHVSYEDSTPKIGGKAHQVDLYPRFETPFIRGGIAEWQQREYAIEYRGKSLTHKRSHVSPDKPLRIENGAVDAEDDDYITALAIYVRTENENMDRFTVARATVRLNGANIAEDVVVAVGPADENTDHDVEWIYLDEPACLSPDVGIEMTHSAFSEAHDSEPHWRMSFRVRALTRSSTLFECAHSLLESAIAVQTGDDDLVADYGAARVRRHHLQLNFEDDNRSTSFLPFAVRTDRWRKPARIESWKEFDAVCVASSGRGYRPYVRLGVVAHSGFVRLRKLSHLPAIDEPWQPAGNQVFPAASRLLVAEPQPDRLFAIVSDGTTMHTLVKEPGQSSSNQSWQPCPLRVKNWLGAERTVNVGLQGVAAVETSSSDVVLWVIGDDNALYRGVAEPRRFEVDWTEWTTALDMPLSPKSCVAAAGGVLYVRDDAGVLWVGGHVRGDVGLPWSWERMDPTAGAFTLSALSPLAAVDVDGVLRKVFVMSAAGHVWCAAHLLGSPVTWTKLDGTDLFPSPLRAEVYALKSNDDLVHVMAVDQTGRLLTRRWNRSDRWDAGGGWRQVSGANDPGAEPDGIWVVSRVVETVEVFWRDAQGDLHWRWWS